MRGIIPILPETAEHEIHIASLVVQIRPEFRSNIEQQINAMKHCTCYSDSQENLAKEESVAVRDNVLVVVMEVPVQDDINLVIADLNQIPDVLTVNLVYHYCDSAISMSDEMEVSR